MGEALQNTWMSHEQEEQEYQGLDARKFLSFMVSGEAYGAEILRIKEIIEFDIITRVPMVPAYIRGVINLRGSVVPVIDLAARLERPSEDATRRTCVVIIEIDAEGETMDIGVVVDQVNEVLDIMDEDIEPAPSFGAKIRADFIYGMGRVNEDFIILLDVQRVLSVAELSMLQGLGGSTGDHKATKGKKKDEHEANNDTANPEGDAE